MDDVRPLNFLQKKAMSVYAEKRVQEELQTRFAYIFAENPYPGAPRIDLKEVIQDQDIQVERSIITPIRAWHGQLPVFGYRFGDFTYLTDLNRIEQTELKKVKGTKILALDALHHNKHHSHLNLEEALALIERIQPDQAYLIHISHRMGLYEEIQKQLPANVALAYDGLQVEL
jgi:phosphoribosyl 1,2-cyclic phosphate phosphodiesterase